MPVGIRSLQIGITDCHDQCAHWSRNDRGETKHLCKSEFDLFFVEGATAVYEDQDTEGILGEVYDQVVPCATLAEEEALCQELLHGGQIIGAVGMGLQISKGPEAKKEIYYIHGVTYRGELVKVAPAQHRIEFLGDSITAAACIFDNAKPSQLADYHTYGMTASWHGYAKKTADALGASHYSVAIGGWKLCYSTNPHISIRSIYPYVSMHSKTTMGPYDFDYNPDVVVINLGTNDWAESQATYQKDALELLQLVREKNPNATIVWAYGMMDEDHPSVNWIRDTVNQFNATDKNAYFIAMRENKNGLWAHPDKEAHIQAGNTLAAFIKDIKGW